MKNLRLATRFRRDLKRIARRAYDLDRLDAVAALLREGETLKQTWLDHGLKGEWTGCRECHPGPDWLLIYETNDDEVILQRTGTHADLFE